ncbi:MAG: glycosyl transferase family 2 [Alphaproteobacteria bacterium]
MIPRDNPVVAIGIPSGDMVHTDFAMSLAMLCMNPGVQSFLLNSRSSLIALGRNQCAGAAQVMKATHLMFFDTDMIFPADTLTRLLAHDKDIVGATYSQRQPPFHPLTITDTGEHAHITSGLQRVRLMPTGCMLIRTSVFNMISKPYFNLEAEGDQLRGEDYYFCEKARAAGVEIWCDGELSCQVGHIGQKIYRITDIVPNN